jgi:hypothetical protein
MRFAMNDQNVKAFIETYDSIPKGDLPSLSWEAICVAAEIEPAYLLGSALLALQAHSVNAVKVIALSNHPKVINARIKAALMPGGTKDRDSFDTALGFLPSSKPATFIKNLTVNQGEKKEMPEEDEPASAIETESELSHLFPPVTEMQDKLVPMRRRLQDGN